jgi:lysozyme
VASNAGKVAAGGLAAVLLLAGGLIAKWEGVRYYPYIDPVGIVTVCYGHTGADIERRAYTRAECNALLDEDMREANAFVRSCIGRPIPVNVEAALTSLVFNLGPGPVCIEGRTPRRFARAGDWPNTCKSLDLYNKAGGRVYRGLVLRRADERAVCEGRA